MSLAHLNQIPWNKDKFHSEETKEKMRLSSKKRKQRDGYIHSPETRKKISVGILKRKEKLGYIHSPETRKKLRISTINRILRNSNTLSIGKNEKQILDEQEIKDNCKIQRQYKIKDLGYIADGYDKEANIIYEVYEDYHNKQKEKDLKRQKEIQNHSHCDFKIIWDKKL